MVGARGYEVDFSLFNPPFSFVSIGEVACFPGAHSLQNVAKSMKPKWSVNARELHLLLQGIGGCGRGHETDFSLTVAAFANL